MVISCCVPWCREYFTKGGKTTFHSFPRDDNRRRIWEHQMGLGFRATNSTKICSKHFTSDCFNTQKFGGTWLDPNAIPTILPRRPKVEEKIEVITPDIQTNIRISMKRLYYFNEDETLQPKQSFPDQFIEFIEGTEEGTSSSEKCPPHLHVFALTLHINAAKVYHY